MKTTTILTILLLAGLSVPALAQNNKVENQCRVLISITKDSDAHSATQPPAQDLQVEVTEDNGTKRVHIISTDGNGNVQEIEWEGTGDVPDFIQPYLVQQLPAGSHYENIHILITRDSEEDEEEETIVTEDPTLYEQLEQTAFPPSLQSDAELRLEEIEFYPVPTSAQLQLSFKTEARPTTVSILDIQGKPIYEETINNFDGYYREEIDLTGHPPGAYFLRISQGKQQHVERLLIQ